MKIHIASRNSAKIQALSSNSRGYRTYCQEYRVNFIPLGCSLRSAVGNQKFTFLYIMEIKVGQRVQEKNDAYQHGQCGSYWNGKHSENFNIYILVYPWVNALLHEGVQKSHHFLQTLITNEVPTQLSQYLPPNHGCITQTLCYSFGFTIFNFH